MVAAMRSKDEMRLGAIRLIKTTLKKHEVDSMKRWTNPWRYKSSARSSNSAANRPKCSAREAVRSWRTRKRGREGAERKDAVEQAQPARPLQRDGHHSIAAGVLFKNKEFKNLTNRGQPNPHSMLGTIKLYLDDDHCFEADASVMAIKPDALACDRTCFYPGGGGQPSDEGRISLSDGQVLEVASVYEDSEGCIWHATAGAVSMIGAPVRLTLNREKRVALSRYHTVLHILNTIALRDHAAWITGAQIGTDYSRIDFKWDGFSPSICAEMEAKVNAVIEANHRLKSFSISEDEFAQRPDLLRTLEVKPPVANGRVRVVAIEGFDEQACGGTHVLATKEIGRLSIFRSENKGRINKRLYVRLS